MDCAADDASLVQEALAGDREAFAHLLARHWSLLLSLCCRMLGNAEMAQDAAQEAALHAFLSLERLRQAENFGPWLGGIGLNSCRHWLRERKYADLSWDALVGGRHYPVYEIPDEEPGPLERAEAGDLRARVRAAVSMLPRGQRAAIVLYYLHGLTQTEVAAHLGIEVGTVKTRLHKARGTLRHQLVDLWEEQQMATPVQSSLVEMRVESVREKAQLKELKDLEGAPRVIILEEVNGPRYLLVHVGYFEGYLLAAALQHAEAPRPLTYTFMANVLRAASVTLREVQINKLLNDVFYATALIEAADGLHTVDARPSDAMNLAAIAGAPIRVASEVLEAAGVTIEKQNIQDEDDKEVIEQTVRRVLTREVIDQVHLDPETLAPIRVLVRQDLRAVLNTQTAP
jgi:RNA polymerase sigma factor (sigma-70 family)